MLLKTLIWTLMSLLLYSKGTAQCNLSLDWEYKYPNQLISPFSIEVDKLDRPYVYVASNEDGIRIISTSGQHINQITANDLGGHAKNLEQIGHRLYVAIGAHNIGNQASFTIIDIQDPTDPHIISSWSSGQNEDNGSGVIRVQEELLFLGAMGSGLYIFNIEDENNIEELSHTTFDINFPFNNPSNPGLYNARGMEVHDNFLYLCNDSGGLYILDVTNPMSPNVLGMYANPITFENGNKPRAYNNVVVNDSIAYIGVDYCGIEVLNIKDPSNIQLMDHYNPVDCPTGVWWDAPVHSNEMVYNKECDQLFVTTGKSELLIMDVSNPMHIEECGNYGSLEDTTATWGLDIRRDSIFLTYLSIPIYIPFLHPFDAKWSGIKMLNWNDNCLSPIAYEDGEKIAFNIYPNPTSSLLHVELQEGLSAVNEIKIINSNGRKIRNYAVDKKKINKFDVNVSNLAVGLYIISVSTNESTITKRFVVH